MLDRMRGNFLEAQVQGGFRVWPRLDLRLGRQLIRGVIAQDKASVVLETTLSDPGDFVQAQVQAGFGVSWPGFDIREQRYYIRYQYRLPY